MYKGPTINSKPSRLRLSINDNDAHLGGEVVDEVLLLEVRVIVAAIDGGRTSGGRQLLVLDDYLVPVHT